MILADNGSGWYVSGASDPRFDDDALHQLGRVKGQRLRGGGHRPARRLVALGLLPPVDVAAPRALHGAMPSTSLTFASAAEHAPAPGAERPPGGVPRWNGELRVDPVEVPKPDA